MWNYITMAFKKFIQEHGLDKMGRYYSIYRGVVQNNEDPDGLGRLIINVPAVHDDETPDNWAWPSCPPGDWKPPQVGEPVYVFFEDGDVQYPIWFFGWWNTVERMPKDATNDVQIWESLSGNRIMMDNKTGDVQVKTKDDHKVEFTKNSILATSKDGMKLEIDQEFKIGKADQSIPLGEKSKTEWEKEVARVDALYDAIANGVVVAQDGGASYQTTMKAILEPFADKKADYSLVLSKKAKTE